MSKVVLRPGIIVQPGSTRENKTGSWRNYYPKFDKDACTACGQCETYCPEFIIYGDKEHKFDADLDYCKGCGICAQVCPKQCIEMVLEVR